MSEVELYRRGRWQFSVMEHPLARACGALPNISPDATFQEAEQALLEHVDVAYGIRLNLTWREVNPEWWVAIVERT